MKGGKRRRGRGKGEARGLGWARGRCDGRAILCCPGRLKADGSGRRLSFGGSCSQSGGIQAGHDTSRFAHAADPWRPTTSSHLN